MKFSEFMEILKTNSSRHISNERFIREIFSALCGEEEPIEANKKSTPEDECNADTKEYGYIGSSKLHHVLRNNDESFRNKLFNSGRNISDGIRTHIMQNKNRVTFVSYLTFTMHDNYSELCEALGISDKNEEYSNLCKLLGFSVNTHKGTVYEAIYYQFLKFIQSRCNDVKNTLPEMICRYSKLKLDGEHFEEYAERMKILELV
jgi:hypothetical protein